MNEEPQPRFDRDREAREGARPGPGRVGAAGVRRVGRALTRACTPGQALVETALALPLVLLLVFGVLGVHRVLQGRGAVDAVAREAARSGAASRSAGEALARAEARGREVAAGYGLAAGAVELAVVPGRFDRSPGDAVRVTARYDAVLRDLPLLGWVRVPLSGSSAELIDPHRSRLVP